MRHKKKEVFYYAGLEVPIDPMDKYRCLDAATLGALEKAKSRIALIMVFFTICFGIILGRLFYLTVVNYQSRQFIPSALQTEIPLIRHNIKDRNGIEIAMSVPTKDLSINPKRTKNPEEVAEQLVRIFPDLSRSDILRKIHAGGSFKYIKRNITPAEQNAVNWLGYYFLNLEDGEKRIYLQNNLFSHIIGTVNIDNQGTSGLEKTYDKELAEQDLYLSLDLSVQEMTRRTLEKGIEKYKAQGGLGLVMDVNTGEVLASVSLPDYNPNLPLENDPDKLFNKATLGSYEFGSVFKLFNTAMALESKDIQPWDVFDGEPIKIGRKLLEDYRGQNRPLTVAEILMHSSNVGSVRIALKAGYEKQREFLGRFGFYKQLPIRLPERATPQFPKAKKWADITSANVAFGYGISVSPLHLIAAVSALVNGGYYHVPTFIKDGNKGMPEYRVISQRTSDIMRHLMWSVINWDIKETNPIFPYAVGGKTGSANLLENGKYVKGTLRTTFVGVFPMNAPKYAVLVVLDNPRGIKETWNFNTAGWNAKPIGLEIITQIAPYLGVAPQEHWEQPAYIQRSIEASKAAKKR